MTVRASQLAALSALGVPLPGTLTGLHAEPKDSYAHGRLHARPDCAPHTVPFLPGWVELFDQPGDVTLTACWACHPGAVELDELLGAYAAYAAGRDRVEYTLTRAEADLAGEPSPAALLSASQLLRYARVDVDPVLSPTGTARLAAEITALPADASACADRYLTEAVARCHRLLERYAATGQIDRMAAAARVQHPRTAVAGVEHYVAVSDPTGQAGRLVQEILLFHTPAVWLGAGWRSWALYRLPGHLAAVLLDVSAELFADGGPVEAGDTGRILTAAASIFDSTDSDAPLADPRTALRIARDLVHG